MRPLDLVTKALITPQPTLVVITRCRCGAILLDARSNTVRPIRQQLGVLISKDKSDHPLSVRFRRLWRSIGRFSAFAPTKGRAARIGKIPLAPVVSSERRSMCP